MWRRGSIIFAALLVSLYIVDAIAQPAPRRIVGSQSRAKARQGHVRRQLEEEMGAGAEEAVELFDYPRVHDTTEQLHRNARGNLSTEALIERLQGEKERHTQEQLHYTETILAEHTGAEHSAKSSSSSSTSAASTQEPGEDPE